MKEIFWLRDESLEESGNLPEPDVLAQEIVDDLEAALEQFRQIAADLGAGEQLTRINSGGRINLYEKKIYPRVEGMRSEQAIW